VDAKAAGAHSAGLGKEGLMRGLRQLAGGLGLALGIWAVTGPAWGFGGAPAGNLDPKIRRQRQTEELLERMDQLFGGGGFALYSNQTHRNVERYKRRYQKALDLLQDLDKNLREWRSLVERNPKDKVYRTFLGTIQLALYAIYGRSDEFLAGLRFSADYQTWYEKQDQWKRNAEPMLAQARESVERALEHDREYPDALALRGQLRILQAALGETNPRVKRDLFKRGLIDLKTLRNRRSYFHSWLGYVVVQCAQELSDTAKGREILAEAAAFSDPPQNSSWALRLRRALDGRQVRYQEFQHHVVEPAEGFKLEGLKEETIDLVGALRECLAEPLKEIPEALDTYASPGQVASQHAGVMLSLDSDASSDNVERFVRWLGRLDRAVEDLMAKREQWDTLARLNESAAFYYLTNKSLCGFHVLHALERTRALAGHRKVLDASVRDPDFEQKWKDWIRKLERSVPDDLTVALGRNPDYLPARLLSFEYAAVFEGSSRASFQLSRLEPVLDVMRYPFDGRAYRAYWRAYLAAAREQDEQVTEYLEEAKTYRGSNPWVRCLEQVVEINAFMERAAAER
jgi:hypothetical protein